MFNLCIGLEDREASSDLDTDDSFYLSAWIWLQKYRPEVTQVALNAVKGVVTNEGQRTPSEAATKLNIGLQLDSTDDSKPVPGDKEEKSSPSETATQLKKRLWMADSKPAPSHLLASIDAPAPKRLSMVYPSLGHLPLYSDIQHDPTEKGRLLGHNTIEQVDQLMLSLLQSQTLDRLITIQSKGKRSCVLIVQPCCTGKSVYYTYFAKQKNTMIIVAQPFTSLKQQTDCDAVRMHVLTKVERGESLKTQLAYEGMLVTTSFEKFHSYVSVSFCPIYFSYDVLRMV